MHIRRFTVAVTVALCMFPATGLSECKQNFINSMGMKFVLIPSGIFMMGSALDPSDVVRKYGGKVYWYGDEHPRHAVTISHSFYLQTTEVTQYQWMAVMGNNPSRFSFCGPDCPVDTIAWSQANEFIARLNKKEGTASYRLPTEAEWEYSCRCGTITPFYTGNCISTDEANYKGSDSAADCPGGAYRKKTVPAGTFLPNKWKLYHMHGNVWEWCADRYGYYDADHATDPSGPSSGVDRVLRGGSWSNDVSNVRSAVRGSHPPDYGWNGSGFRVARDCDDN